MKKQHQEDQEGKNDLKIHFYHLPDKESNPESKDTLNNLFKSLNDWRGAVQNKTQFLSQINNPEFQIGRKQENDQKEGTWCELEYQGYNCNIVTKGNYVKNLKEGKWLYYIINFLDDKIEEIGQRNYFQGIPQGLEKIPIVFESQDSFEIFQQTCYRFNGVKRLQSYISKYNIMIESGEYDGFSKKCGYWTELLRETVRFSARFIYFVCQKGKYEEGQKQGFWKQYLYRIKINKTKDDIYDVNDPVLISKGTYINNLKDGDWFEPCLYEIECVLEKVHLQGKYIQGRKLGEWKELKQEGEKEACEPNYKGQYDEQGKKTGQWIEFKKYWNFTNPSSTEQKIMENGQYAKGNRIQDWVQIVESHTQNKIARQKYNDDGQIYSNFKKFEYVGMREFQLLKIIGQFQDGKRVNEWITLIENSNQEYKICEKGKYIDDIKIGEWMEAQLFEVYSENDIFIYLLRQKGEYDQKGNKIGIWVWELKLMNQKEKENFGMDQNNSENQGNENNEENDENQANENSNNNENQIEDLSINGKLKLKSQGRIQHTPDQLEGDFIVFGSKFESFDARFQVFEIFSGKVVNGQRHQEWKFADRKQLLNQEEKFNDTTSEIDEIQQIDQEKENKNEGQKSNGEQESEEEAQNIQAIEGQNILENQGQDSQSQQEQGSQDIDGQNSQENEGQDEYTNNSRDQDANDIDGNLTNEEQDCQEIEEEEGNIVQQDNLQENVNEGEDQNQGDNNEHDENIDVNRQEMVWIYAEDGQLFAIYNMGSVVQQQQI